MSRILEVSGLSKHMGDSMALDGCSFSLESGRIVGLLGPNGAGKSTLLKTLAGVLRPDQGTVTLRGEPGGVQLRRAGGPVRPPPALPCAGRTGYDLAAGLRRRRVPRPSGGKRRPSPMGDCKNLSPGKGEKRAPFPGVFLPLFQKGGPAGGPVSTGLKTKYMVISDCIVGFYPSKPTKW